MSAEQLAEKLRQRHQRLVEELALVDAALQRLDTDVGRDVVQALAVAGCIRSELNRRPRGLCPVCKEDVALTRDRKLTWMHDPCGTVQMATGKRYLEGGWEGEEKTDDD